METEEGGKVVPIDCSKSKDPDCEYDIGTSVSGMLYGSQNYVERRIQEFIPIEQYA